MPSSLDSSSEIPPATREVAWNGVRLKTPDSWAVKEVGERYLRFEGPASSGLEIKWSVVRGRFSQKTHLRRLGRLGRGSVKGKFRERPLSSSWKEAANAYESTGFAWENAVMAGEGCLLFCPECRTATLVQFFRPVKVPSSFLESAILGSYRDHGEEGRTLWSIFDIRADIPSSFELRRHRFEPGRFLVNLASKEEKLVLVRWGPASVVLHRFSLPDLAQTQFGFQVQEGLRSGKEDDFFEWSAKRSGRFLSRLKGLGKGMNYRQYRLWKVPEKNRILGLGLEGRKPWTPERFERLCAGFVAL